MNEENERLAVRGPRGDRGEPGMTRGARHAVVFLFALTLVLSGVNLVFTAHAVNTSDRKWCTTVGLLTATPVPRPADPAANPSREASYRLYADFVQLKKDLGCD